MTKISKSLASVYSKPLPSTRSGALYNAFSYVTKISPEAIAVFIATHTKPGDKILDVFGGSGTTGLAALLCDKPSEVMIQMALDLGVEPQWGPRHAVVHELSTLGAFVATVLACPIDPQKFEVAAKQLLAKAEKKLGWIYEALDPNGEKGFIRYSIWSDVLVCSSCKTEVPYWDAAVRWEPIRLVDTFTCPTCEKITAVNACERALETVYDPFLGQSVERKKRVIAQVYGKSKSGNWNRNPTEQDEQVFLRAAGKELPASTPNGAVFWGDLYRAGYHKGISHFHQFYTGRNFLAIATLWELTNEFPEDLRDSLRLLILSYNGSHSTLMTRVVVKDGGKEFVLTGAQTGVLYISGLPVEKNVFEGIKRKVGSLSRAFETVKGSRSTVQVINASSTKIQLPDSSVDYVFTDPPFGDYIPYAEINQINEVWLGQLTDRTEEVIMSTAQGKNVDDYGRMMGQVFQEVARVMKPNALATVVFHSAKASVWKALTEAYDSAGLSVRATSVLDKIQASFKQVVSTVSVKGDPLLLLSKGAASLGLDGITAEDIATEIIEQAKHAIEAERGTQRLYSRFISRCLEVGEDVHLGAREFYERAEKALNE